jgi:hypothetical protein
MVNKDDEEEDEDCEDIITDEDVLVFCEKEKLGYVRNKLEEANNTNIKLTIPPF